MRLEILGNDGGIGHGLLTTAFRLDDDILIDAGTGVGVLPLDEMARIEHVFLTHAHLDHAACLPLLLDATAATRQRPLVLHGLEETLRALQEHIFNWTIWPDFARIPSAERPILAYAPVTVGEPVVLGKRRIIPVPANHDVHCRSEGGGGS